MFSRSSTYWKRTSATLASVTDGLSVRLSVVGTKRQGVVKHHAAGVQQLESDLAA